MTQTQRYLFDLQGFLVVEDALSPETVAALNASIEAKWDEEGAGDAVNRRFGKTLDWCPTVRRVIDNPTVSPLLSEMLGARFRLDHDYIDVIRGGRGPVLGPIGAHLHGGGEPYDPGQFYQFKNGRMFNGLTVVAYALKDIRPGDGGFACVPGSHKANFRLPDDWVDMSKHLAPQVHGVSCKAGDAVIFTEALTHGTLPWQGADDRRTLFLKYAPHFLAWASPSYDPDAHDDLTPDARRLLEGANYRYRGRKGAVE